MANPSCECLKRTELSLDTRRCQKIQGGKLNRCKEKKLVPLQDAVNYFKEVSRTDFSFSTRLVGKKNKLVSTQDYVKYFTEVSRTDVSFNTRRIKQRYLYAKRTAVSVHTRRCQKI